MKKTVLLFFQALIWPTGNARPVQLDPAALPIKTRVGLSRTNWIRYEVDTTMTNLAVDTQDGPGHPDVWGQLRTLIHAIVYGTHGDTINILVGSGGTSGPGLRLVLAGDSCSMYYLLSAGGTPIAPLTCRLVLSQKPACSTGLPICGKIEFEGVPSHGKNGGHETDIRYLVYGPFRARSTKQ